MGDISTAELCDRFEQLYTGLVADVLDSMGYRDQIMNPDITPINPDQTVAGAAYPAVGRRNRSVDYEAQAQRFLEMLEAAPTDSCLVLDANTDNSAQVGELTTRALTQRGCRGVVTNGGTRDTKFIREQEFPVYVGFQTPADSLCRWELLDWDTTAVVGGVEVTPGDIVFGDIDGVTVVPEDIAEDVLLEAERMRDDETAVRDAVADGVSPKDAYDEYGTF
jgi:4-hydroxy-4-methyl-2-oxoglutarate aldolase